MIEMLLNDPSWKDYDISSLRTIAYGGAPMYLERIKAAVATFGPIFVQTYGLGEAPRGITCLTKADHAAFGPAGEKRLGSAGRESCNVQVRVVDDDGQPLDVGEEGEVVVRGELVMQGYWNNPAATAETLRNGWLHTGDIGYFDRDGYLFLTDRKKDMIISGGSNVYPREVEEVLYRHPAVLEACVFGVPDATWGERIIASVVLRNGSSASDDELIRWCRQNLASYKKPSEVFFLAELPKSGIGKILKREIRQRLFPARQ
jgi:long-chain acyl-CoA synthetase